MPWKECNKMDERVRFVARLLEGEKMAPLCRSFGISRKTGYKIFQRYKDMGLEGAHRPFSATLSASQSAALSSRAAHRVAQEGAAELGRAQDPRKAAAGSTPTSTRRLRARCTPCSTGTAW